MQGDLGACCSNHRNRAANERVNEASARGKRRKVGSSLRHLGVHGAEYVKSVGPNPMAAALDFLLSHGVIHNGNERFTIFTFVIHDSRDSRFASQKEITESVRKSYRGSRSLLLGR